MLLEPSAARDRLTAGIFLPMDAGEPLRQLEETLRKVIAAEPVERKLWAGPPPAGSGPGPTGRCWRTGSRPG